MLDDTVLEKAVSKSSNMFGIKSRIASFWNMKEGEGIIP
jgi:hypothetical protein